MTALYHLPLLLAQASDTDLPDTTGQPGQISGTTLAIIGLFYCGIFLLWIIGQWGTFSKAGQPGWAAIIPFYNLYIMGQVAKKSNWWLLLIPLVQIVYIFIISAAIARQFGKGTGFGVGLVFLPFIFYPILGFGSAKYLGIPEMPAGAPAMG